MKAQKLFFAVVAMFTLVLSTSCTKQDIADEETELQAIDGNEIQDGDM